MLGRFRYLTKEAPDKPIRWPLLIGKLLLLFLKLYAIVTGLMILESWWWLFLLYFCLIYLQAENV